ncbi:unnamed protein product [Anisakis simplex]|uniref:C2H2-type domain-containing protein n=1 Tax=Anisakis simplex TaxID=6269 RepID=A0A0M3KGJ3_ANISI|nr:unnamed protein product [Anisakis simplex]
MRPYKCGQCSKRYKTQAGLSNHLHQAHQRVATTVSQSLTPNLVPVSPSALSNSSATHLHTSSTAVDTSHNTTIISSSSSKSAMPSNQIGMTVSNAVSQQQGTMRLSSTQPVQTAPPPTAAGHQYHQQVSASNQSNLSSQQNIQVRSVGVALSSGGNSRSNSNINSSSMVDQQRISQSQYSAVIDPQPQIMSDQMQQRGNLQSGMQQQQQQQQKMPGRVMSAGSNMALVNRNAYHQHSANG